MGIERPLGEEDIGRLGGDELAVLGIPCRGDLGGAIDLAGEYRRAGAEDLAGFLGLGRAGGGGVMVRLAGDASLTAGEVPHPIADAGEAGRVDRHLVGVRGGEEQQVTAL